MQVKLGIDGSDLGRLPDPVVELLIRSLLLPSRRFLAAQALVFLLDAHIFAVLRDAHAVSLRLAAKQHVAHRLIAVNGGRELGNVAVGDAVAAHERVNDRLLGCKLRVLGLILAEAAVDNALDFCGVGVLVLPVYEVAELFAQVRIRPICPAGWKRSLHLWYRP